jgi:hypothetical protein
MIPYYIMVIDILPSSKLDIQKYLDRHGVTVFSDYHKENRFRNKCEHDEFCDMFNELVMMKDFQRDDRLNIEYKMDKITEDVFVFENSHISNLVYCRLSNKKLYKHYMKELKNRRRQWVYYAIIISKEGQAKNKKDQKIIKELEYVLEQSQIKFKHMDKWDNVTYLRKDILKEITDIKASIQKHNNKVSQDNGF